jgi:hypothetical protein
VFIVVNFADFGHYHLRCARCATQDGSDSIIDIDTDIAIDLTDRGSVANATTTNRYSMLIHYTDDCFCALYLTTDLFFCFLFIAKDSDYERSINTLKSAQTLGFSNYYYFFELAMACYSMLIVVVLK